MKQQASPAVVAIAVIVLLGVIFGVYKMTLGKGTGTAPEAVPDPGGYGAQMQQMRGGK